MYIKKIIDSFITKLFPYRCILCNLRSDQRRDLCYHCQIELPWITNGCKLCGQKISPEVYHQTCGDCLKEIPPYENFLTLFEYTTPVISLVKQLKFDNKLLFAHVLGDLLSECIRKNYLASHLPQLLIPIPLHTKRVKERGYNQALVIARVLSKQLGIPIDYQSTIRHKNTAAQSSLSAQKRIENMRHAFDIQARIDYSHVAIIDDVITTGNTVKEFSRLLKKNGVQRIDLWCLAKTQLE